MLGLVLEGGGARGAFHIGAIKALIENGYEFQAVAGTSIGAINGALLAQGDFELCSRLWEEMKPESIFDVQDYYLEKIFKKQMDQETFSYFAKQTKRALSEKGVDTDKIHALLNKYIDEEKIRKSPINYGLVTVLVDGFKPVELLKKDIPEGQLVDYVMASASFPIFKPRPIDEKIYVDGGFYNNCPVNLVAEMGCDDVIEIRTFGIGKVQKFDDPNVKVRSIIPSGDLGNVMNFNHELIMENMEMGYYDALRMLNNYQGKRYYIDTKEGFEGFNYLNKLDKDSLYLVGSKLKSKIVDNDVYRSLFEDVVPKIINFLDIDKNSSYKDILLAMVEYVCTEGKLNFYEVYDFTTFLEKAQEIIKRDNLLNKKMNWAEKTFAKKNPDVEWCIYKLISSL